MSVFIYRCDVRTQPAVTVLETELNNDNAISMGLTFPPIEYAILFHFECATSTKTKDFYNKHSIIHTKKKRNKIRYC